MERVGRERFCKNVQFVAGLNSPDAFMEWYKKYFDPKSFGVAMTGRSNVGKSSLINALLQTKMAHTSKTPGRTQQINVFRMDMPLGEGEQFSCYLFDLPGHGHAKVSKEMKSVWEGLMQIFFKTMASNLCFVQIQDARHPHTETDQLFNDFLVRFHPESVLVFNKMDKLKRQSERAILGNYRRDLCKLYPWVKQIHFVSAEGGEGMAELQLSLTTALHHRYLKLSHIAP